MQTNTTVPQNISLDDINKHQKAVTPEDLPNANYQTPNSETLPKAPDDANFTVNNPQNFDDYYRDQKFMVPTVGQSMWADFKLGALSFGKGLEAVNQAYLGAPPDEQLDRSYNALTALVNNPNIGTGQAVGDWVANMAGSLANPLNDLAGLGAGKVVGYGLGKVSGLLAEDAAAFLDKPITDVIGENSYYPKSDELGIKRAATIGETGTELAKTGASTAAFMVPQEEADNYDRVENTIDQTKVIEGSILNGGMGLLLHATPYTVGTIWKKIFGSDAKLPQSATETEQAKIDEALDKKVISPDAHALLTDYLKNPDDPTIAQRAAALAKQDGINANTALAKIVIPLMKDQDRESFNNAIWDQAASDGEVAPETSKSLSDYILNNRTDETNEKLQSMSDGVQSVIDFMEDKQNKKEAILKEVDDNFDQRMLKAVNEHKEFTQAKIDKMLKNANYETSHVDNLPLVIPDNLLKRGRSLQKLRYLSDKLKEEIKKQPDVPDTIVTKVKKLFDTIANNPPAEYEVTVTEILKHPKVGSKQTIRRIKELSSSMPKVLTPKEELTSIKEKLLPKEGLPDNFEKTKEYQRLEQLSEVWHQARALLQRVRLENEFKKQNDYKNVLQSIKNISDANLGKTASTDNVINYYKQKVESLTKPQKVSELTNVEEIKEAKTEQSQAEILKQKTEEVKASNAGELTEAYDQSLKKYNELKERTPIFKKLIACLTGE